MDVIPEPISFLPNPDICPYVLVDDHGWPVFQTYANGQTFVAGYYKSLRGARRGRARWGGRIWNRVKREFETHF